MKMYIIPNDIHTTYTAIGASHSYPSGQATVVRAYVSTAEATYTVGGVEHHVVSKQQLVVQK